MKGGAAMSIRYVRGDLLASHESVLVIPVNCRGVAGKGLALQCKQRYPAWFVSYCAWCRSGHLRVGNPVLDTDGRRWFLNFPTKDSWRLPSRLEYVDAGLRSLVVVEGPWWCSDKTLAFPQLGCGAGGLSWSQVQPVMEHYLSQLPCTSLIYVG
jgi:O-acetyl-ADP-ribose deacetylase (regulator of RNase III)